MRKIKMMVIGILVAGMVVGSCGASWGAPMKINVQGRLEYTTSTTPGTITFRIYEGGDESGGGRDAWTDKRGIIETGTPGPDQVLLDPATKIFNVVLGPKDDTDRDMPEFFTDDYYLEVLVESETLTPRQQLVSVPYAITARNLKGGRVDADGGTSIAVFARSSGGYAVHGQSDATDGIHGIGARGGVLGFSSTGYGVYGKGATAGGSFESTDGYGVYGKSTNQSGVYGETSATTPFIFRGPFIPIPICKGGVVGRSTATSRGYPGVKGESVSGWGVYGSGEVGVVGFGRTAGGSFESASGVGVYGGSGSSGGIYGFGADGVGVVGIGRALPAGWTETDVLRSGAGIRGFSSDDNGVEGFSTNAYGVYGESGDGGYGVYAVANTGTYFADHRSAIYAKNTGRTGIAIEGRITRSDNYYPAIWGESAGTSSGVYGKSANGNGVVGVSVNEHGVVGLGGGASMPTLSGTYNYSGLFAQGPGCRALGVNGSAYATGSFHGGMALDIAEWVRTTDPNVNAGDVVVIDRGAVKAVTKANRAYDSLVAGIVSTNPNYLAGNIVENNEVLDTKEIEARGYRMLALAGQVPCKVSTENGPIAVGDLLTTSNTPGYAMKATDPKIGTILGKAMEPLASGNGKIMVLVTLQ